MEELRQMALAYHSAANKETKDLVAEFFEAMDPERKGFVTLTEFSEYTRLIGRPEMGSERFFDELRLGSSGSSNHYGLGPIEVLTLYYIIQSGRPFCDSCGNFVKGTFFTCTTCLNNNNSNRNGFNGRYSSRGFNVCPQCVVDKKYVHDYGHKELVDPFTLLHLRKMENFVNHATWHHEPSAPSYLESFYNIGDSSQQSSSFLNEVRERQNRPPKNVADRIAVALQLALSLGNFLAAVGGCTIM